MKSNKFTPKKNVAQAMVEFAIVLPILLLLLYGLLEAGRLLFMYSSIVTSSRQAVRYGSATGLGTGTTTVERYRDCKGIRETANKTDYLNAFDHETDDVKIFWDEGPDDIVADRQICLPGEASSTWTPSDENKSRIIVKVRGHFYALVKLVPFPDREIKAESSRTILMSVSIDVPVPGGAAAPEPTTIDIADEPDPSPVGEVVPVTVTIGSASGPPDGTVTFSFEATPVVGCIDVSLTSGVYTCDMRFSVPGKIKVVFTPTDSAAYGPSDMEEDHTVETADVTVTVYDNPAESLPGTSVVVSAKVRNLNDPDRAFITPTGSVVFTNTEGQTCTDDSLDATGFAYCSLIFTLPSSTITADYISNDGYHNNGQGTGDHVTSDNPATEEPTEPPPTEPPTEPPVITSLKVQILGGTDNIQQTAFRYLVQNIGTSAVTNISTRLYFTTDDSNSASSYVLEKYGDQSGSATVLGPTLASGSTYYFTVNYGSASLPAGGSWEFQTALHLSTWGSAYVATNDWWHGSGTLPASYTDWASLPAYASGSRVWGSEPAGPPPVAGCNSIQNYFLSLPPPRIPPPPPYALDIPGTTTTMRLVIPNPNSYPVEINSIFVVWNGASGFRKNPAKTEELRLMKVELNGILWQMASPGQGGSSFTIPAPYSIPAVIPPGGATLTFTFDKIYNNPLNNGTELVTIQFSTPGCEAYPITVTRPAPSQ